MWHLLDLLDFSVADMVFISEGSFLFKKMDLLLACELSNFLMQNASLLHLYSAT